MLYMWVIQIVIYAQHLVMTIINSSSEWTEKNPHPSFQIASIPLSSFVIRFHIIMPRGDSQRWPFSYIDSDVLP